MSANTTSTRLRVASNAGAGYEPGPRNGVPEGPTGILKQNEGKMQTGLAYTENANGAVHVAPPSRDTATKFAVPFPPWIPLSNVRYSAPSGPLTMRWS